MPVIDEDGMSRLLKAEQKPHIWCVFGDDAYLKDFYVNKLIAQTVDENLRFFNFHVYEDDEKELEEIFADAENLPVMSPQTCLLVKDYPLHQLGDRQREAFEAGLANAPASTVLLFTFNKLNVSYDKRANAKWFSLINVFAKYGAAVNLSHRTRAKTVRMLVKGAAARGTSIGQAEAEYLAETVGDDIQTLLNEFNKVCAYADGRPVTREMIDATAVKTVEASVFDISEALFTGNADRAFETAAELLRQKTAVQAILGALASAYVNIYRLQIARSADKTADDFAEAFGYKTGSYAYTFRKIAPFARRCPPENVRASLDVLIRADVQSKSTATDANTLLTQVLAELAAYAG